MVIFIGELFTPFFFILKCEPPEKTFSATPLLIPCSNFDLPGIPELPLVTGIWVDKTDAIVWIRLDKLKNEKVGKLALDVCQVVTNNAGVPYLEALQILTKDMYVSRMTNSDNLNVNFL